MLPLATSPGYINKGAIGTRSRGNAYEKRVGEWLRPQIEGLGWQLFDHPWITNGDSVCQPDYLAVAPSGCVLIIEVKLTQCDCSLQLAKYKKALAAWPTVGLQIARRLTSPSTVDCLENAIDNGVMLLWI